MTGRLKITDWLLPTLGDLTYIGLSESSIKPAAGLLPTLGEKIYLTYIALSESSMVDTFLANISCGHEKPVEYRLRV